MDSRGQVFLSRIKLKRATSDGGHQSDVDLASGNLRPTKGDYDVDPADASPTTGDEP